MPLHRNDRNLAALWMEAVSQYALKFCLLSMGVWVGSFLTGKAGKPVRKVCVLVFWVTYIPLMLKLAQVVYRSLKRREAGPEL